MSKPIAIQGMCYDANSSFMTGSANAPSIIKEAFYSNSINAYTELGENVVDSDHVKFVDELHPQDFLNDIKGTVSGLIADGNKVVSLGGDHSIVYPIIAAHAEYYDHIEILQIDAHSDLYDNFEENEFSHASPFARIMENGLAARLIQVGIRCLTPHLSQQSVKYNVEVIEMKDYSIHSLPELSNPIYLSLDLDGIDPAYAPGVSHHEPGGLSSRQVIDIIHKINVPIIGALSPLKHFLHIIFVQDIRRANLGRS